ncbi:MAG TPA: hypothetical protein PKZ01_13495, partial [Candidatus Hydrogenedentes bacterium]|nr:hypothetical protein [Candidatus Hydrogenedentota bacterium]
MSSILDALRKLEEEKATESRASALQESQESAEDELIGRRTRSSDPLRLSPAMLIGGGVILALAVFGLALFVALYAVRNLPAESVAQQMQPAVPPQFSAPVPVPVVESAPMAPVAASPVQSVSVPSRAVVQPEPPPLPVPAAPSVPQTTEPRQEEVPMPAHEIVEEAMPPAPPQPKPLREAPNVESPVAIVPEPVP